MKNKLTFPVLVFALFTLTSGCGKDESNPSSQHLTDNPVIKPGLTPEERQKYCFLRTDLESPSDSLARITDLTATWTYYPANSSEGFHKKEFRFDPANRIAAVTTYYDYWKDVQSITFRKACVSKPLSSQQGFYEGYRILELLADNNEGALALLVKIDPSGDGRVLTLSDPYYGRYAADTLASPDTVFQSGQIRQVWIFRDPR